MIPEPSLYSCTTRGVVFNTAIDLKMHDHEQHGVLFSRECPCEVCQVVCGDDALTQPMSQNDLYESNEQSMLSGIPDDDMLNSFSEIDWDAAILSSAVSVA